MGGECCTEKKMSIQRFDSQTDLLIIPMGDSQVVLRVYDEVEMFRTDPLRVYSKNSSIL